MNDSGKLPVVILSGFLGAGKTTLLKRILTNTQGLKVAVIVNDMAELNVDGQDLLADIVQAEATMVEMTNGCICCTLRGDLLEQVRELASSSRYDLLVIESTGISEPIGVVATFSFVDEQGFSLNQLSYIDCLVTVLNTPQFFLQLSSLDSLQDQAIGQELEDDQRTIADLLAAQVECANVLVLNRVDEIAHPVAEVKAIEAILTRLNPRAKLIQARHCQFDLKEILDTHLFEEAAMQEFPSWAGELASVGDGNYTTETEEYGVSSFVYRAHRPIHSQRLASALEDFPDGILRIKGFCWFANRPHNVCFWSQAGPALNLEVKGSWWADTPKDQWPRQSDSLDWIQAHWKEPWGDRRQELVIIGVELDPQQVARFLDATLLTDSELELGVDVWRNLEDPFGISESPSTDDRPPIDSQHGWISLAQRPDSGAVIAGAR